MNFSRTPEYFRQYRRDKRTRWLRLGLVQPRDAAEARLFQPRPVLKREGSGPLAMWIPKEA